MQEFLTLFGDIRLSKVVMIIVAIVFLYKTYKLIENTIVTRYKQNEEQQNKLDSMVTQLEGQQDALISTGAKLDRIATQLSNLDRKVNEIEPTMSRYRVLRFNDEILHGERHSKEHFDQILEDITHYENYCETHPEYENNKAVLAIANITKIYQKCSEENSFL